MQVVLDVGK